MLPHFAQENEKSRSTKVVEEDDNLKKIECLRGRLLAEREASKIAKENAQYITDKLIELEKQLKEETKLRDRAEKKLKFLKQKLGSVQVSVSLPESEQSSSVSENSLGSCESSTMRSNLVPKDHHPEDEHRELLQPDSTISPIVQNNVNVVEARKSDQTHDVKSPKKGLDSQTRAFSPENLVENRHRGDENVKSDEQSCSSVVEKGENHHDVDNSLALVPIDVPGSEKTTKELVITDQSVAEVLETLRHARERIEHTLRQRRHMIKVGPTPTPTQPQIC